MGNYSYSDKLKKLKNRRLDMDFIVRKVEIGEMSHFDSLLESYEKLEERDVYKYFIGSMEEVDKIYTKNTFKEAERVQNQLDKIKTSELNFEYRYQGSVSNNTHIKAYSDVDILVIIDKFITLEKPQVPSNPYKGNPENDLYNLRIECEEHLKKTFYSADIDCTGAKSISMEGGSLRRKIDVVPSNWFNTNLFAQTSDERFRGVYVLDKHKMERIGNTPFFHNFLLGQKDTECQKNYKKLVRLLKTLKADSNKEIDFSSYDITGLIYNMDNSKFFVGKGYLILLRNLKNYLEFVLNNNLYRDELYVPDRSRKIFDGTSKKIIELGYLKEEVDILYDEIYKDLSYSDYLLENKRFAI
jgi:hypothetical protein